MKTTVDIPYALYGQATKLAAVRGQEVEALITEGLQKLVVDQLPDSPPKVRRNGKSARSVLPPKAAKWLAEWRTLGQRAHARGVQTPSAAETVRQMRR